MTDSYTLLAIVGMAAVTVVTRCLFFISLRPMSIPHWLQRGLQYAPIAAVAAVTLPEILVQQGHLAATWQDARIFGALAGLLGFAWRRTVLATMVAGMAAYLPLRLLLGW